MGEERNAILRFDYILAELHFAMILDVHQTVQDRSRLDRRWFNCVTMVILEYTLNQRYSIRKNGNAYIKHTNHI